MLWIALGFMTVYFRILENAGQAVPGARAFGALFLGSPAVAFSGFAGAFGAFTQQDSAWGAVWSVLMVLGSADVVFLMLQVRGFQG